MNERQALLSKQQASNERIKIAGIKGQELQLQKELEEEKCIIYAYKHPENGNIIIENILAGSLINNKKTKRIVEGVYTVAEVKANK